MTHRKWSHEWAMSPKWVDEHNALYDEWVGAEARNTAAHAALAQSHASNVERACAARLAFLGANIDEAVPWDELKPCIQERWTRAVDAIRPAAVTDAQIEKMAEAMRASYCEFYGIPAVGELPDQYREYVRAALAAVGPQTDSRGPMLDAKCHQQTKRCMSWRKCFNLAFRLKNKYRAELEAVKAERDAAARTQPVKVKVRWDVTAEDACLFIFDHRTKRAEEMSRIMHYLAAHAVIDAPAGVPSLPELVKLYETVRDSREPRSGLPLEHAVTAIRNAVLAGGQRPISVMSEEEAWKLIEPGFGDDLDPLVDEYVRGVKEVTGQSETSISYSRTGLRYVKNAVLASLTSSAPTPEQVEALARVLVRQIQADGGADEVALARAAFAHIQPEMPKGLPTNDEVAQVIYQLWTSNVGAPKKWDGWHNKEFFVRIADGVIAALAPYLRDPVGWELDIEPGRTYEAGSSGIYFSEQCDIDWLRSRIRPVMECKECANLEQMYVDKNNECHTLKMAVDRTYSAIKGVLTDAARAALEGE